MACEDIQAKLNSLEQQKAEKEAELKDLGPESSATIRAKLNQQLQTIKNDIAGVRADLEACLNPIGTPHAPAPQGILEIQHQNSAAPSDPSWAASGRDLARTWIPAGDPTFPVHRDLEWIQVLAPTEEYDQIPVIGASGWVLGPENSKGDVPFDHPFGFDWEFRVAVDDKYAPLLSPANVAGFDDGPGLGVELDRGLLPPSFRGNVSEGDRVAVFGRWILDQGHRKPDSNYRTEIHPPLLLATASVQQGPIRALVPYTRVLFASRPYLASQTYTRDPSKAYDDRADDDGPLFEHLVKEIRNVMEFSSNQVEAHPKIKSYPFRGPHAMHIVVRPPPIPGGSPPDPTTYKLTMSFQFTVRSGCAVQVISTANDAIDVLVVLNQVGYTPPALPQRIEHTWSREDLDALSSGTGIAILVLDALAGGIESLVGGTVGVLEVERVLSKGIKTDAYGPIPDVDILDSSNAISNVSADQIPAGAGIRVNDDQPYPIYGWLEARWEPRIPKRTI
jgi:hypothetical protein